MFSFFGNGIPSSPEKHVVVIGGGIAGMSAISSLRKEDEQVKITLVDPKAYSELLWAAFRTPFDEELAKGTIIRLEKFCATHQVEFVQATVGATAFT